MKRFLIPAFFVVDVADYEDENAAVAVAAEMQNAANVAAERVSSSDSSSGLQRFLLLDEETKAREVPIVSGETELPHAFKWTT